MLDSYNKLTSSGEFKDWKSKNKDSYLSSCFKVIDEKNSGWQFDFYNKDNTITSFTADPIEITENQEIFQKEKVKIEKLDLKKIKISLDDSIKIINDKYKENFLKTIVILQPYVWNITQITSTFKILNVKIDAITKKIISEKYESILSLKT